MISASWRAALVGALVAALATLPGLGAGTLWDNSETAYGEVAREILIAHDWIVMHFNGAPWFVQPPLYFWIAAAFASLLGPTELADLNEGRMYEGRSALEDALAHFRTALDELKKAPFAGAQRKVAVESIERVTQAIDRRDAELREQARVAEQAKEAAAPTVVPVKVTWPLT